MKQETIDLIKSMTEQGFLVIVDPEKVNDEDRAIIKVMAFICEVLKIAVIALIFWMLIEG